MTAGPESNGTAPETLRLEAVTKAFGDVVAVDNVTLELPAGKLVCLLGPSGCGKTTLLRLIAGLEAPTRGHIRLGERDLTHVPAHQRDFGMVFQSLALFPHLTVGENIAYALRIRGQKREQQGQRIDELLQLVQLAGLADRHIAQLSGGQRQRVAIARALAIHPKLFLLDEPLSALDAKLREAMQVELRLLQRRLGITTVLVTHDQREAMTMSDLVVVMNQGRVLQAGAPLEIYRRPESTFVADFIGSSNLIPCTVLEDGAIDIGGHRMAIPNLDCAAVDSGRAILSVRPEDLHLAPGGGETANRLAGTVTFVRDLGASIEISIDSHGHALQAIATPKDRLDLAIGSAVAIGIAGDSCVVLAQ